MVRAYTPLEGPACGIQLERSKTYLLLGYLRENKLSLRRCQWHQLWEDITRQQRRGLRRLYGRNCDCRIEKFCLKPEPETCDDMIDGCNVPDSDGKVTICKKKYSFCVKNKSGNSCRWVKKSPAFKKCLSKNQAFHKCDFHCLTNLGVTLSENVDKLSLFNHKETKTNSIFFKKKNYVYVIFKLFFIILIFF